MSPPQSFNNQTSQNHQISCKHIAFVMDGNGRWATQKGLSRSAGHEAGAEALFDVLKEAHEMGVEWITVFGFSTENWSRPGREVKHLLDFNYELIIKRRNELNERGIRVYFVGRDDKRVPKRLVKEMKKTEELTKNNTEGNLITAFNYGGRAEIVDAVRSLVAAGSKPEDITEESINGYLYVPDAPYPDLVVRTSGESRISNFLLWQIAYSELIFCDVLWPDFGSEQLKEVMAEYERRERRYGGL